MGACAPQFGQLIVFILFLLSVLHARLASSAQVAHVQPPRGGDQSFGGVGRKCLPGVELGRGCLRFLRQLNFAGI